jgi:hypothetical protein
LIKPKPNVITPTCGSNTGQCGVFVERRGGGGGGSALSIRFLASDALFLKDVGVGGGCYETTKSVSERVACRNNTLTTAAATATATAAAVAAVAAKVNIDTVVIAVVAVTISKEHRLRRCIIVEHQP